MPVSEALTKPRQLNQTRLEQLAVERFGPDPRWFTFGCPRCGTLADAGDFLLADADPNRVGQHCIGRVLGALGPDSSSADGGRAQAARGCDWAANGLFPGPWQITVPARSLLSGEIDPEAPTKVVGGFALAETSRDAERTEDERAAVRAAWTAYRAERSAVTTNLDDGTTYPDTDGPTATEETDA